MDDDQTLFIAERGNDRIVEWPSNATKGAISSWERGPGNQSSQLHWLTEVIVDQENHSFIIADLGKRRVIQWSRQHSTEHEQILLSDIACYGLTMDEKGSLYVSDGDKNEVKRWKIGETKRTVVAGENSAGDQLHYPTFLLADANERLYVSDKKSHQVMKWRKGAKERLLVAGGNGQGQSWRQLSLPQGIMVDPFGQMYVADYGNARVMRWYEGTKEGTMVVGGNGQGQQVNQLSGPTSLYFDRQGSLCR